MENPTLEQMEAWRDQATERLSLFARSNAIEEPIGIGEECYQLGEDCYKPDGYDQFRWVTEDQFDSVLPPGIEHDRYIAMTNMTGFDDVAKEWSANWNDPGYWHDAAADALWSSNDGAYWTTRDEDPSDAVMRAPPPHRRSPLNWTPIISSNARRRTSDCYMTSSIPSMTWR